MITVVKESSEHEPKLGKKVKQLKGWKIYKGTDNYGNETYRCFTPEEDYPEVGYEDWEVDTLDQAISWIENYDEPVDESCKKLQESTENPYYEIYEQLDNISYLSSEYDADDDTDELENLSRSIELIEESITIIKRHISQFKTNKY